MGDDQHNGASGPPEGRARMPFPVPEWPTTERRAPSPAEPTASATVTDEDRERFGVLLDRAAERGLLPPSEYEVRLRELARATSVEQMTQIVSELPAFTVPPLATATSAHQTPSPVGFAFGADQASTRRRTSPWVMLVVLVVVVAVALVVLALYAQHLVHSHTGGTGQGLGAALSALRL